MPLFSLSPEAIPLLCQALMAGIAGAYVFSLPRKTRSAWWLGTLLLGNGLFAVSFMLGTVTNDSEWALRFNMGLYMGVGLAGLSGLRLAYSFLGRPFRREERLACGAATAALATLVTATLVAQVTLDESWFVPILYGYGAFLLATTVGALAVHLRQARRYRRLAAHAPTRHDARRAASGAHHAMAGLTGVTVLLSIINALSTVGVLSPLAINYASLILELAIDVGLIVVFINHAPEPTTVQAKLIGVMLGAVLMLVGLSSLALMRPIELAEAAGNNVPEALTVRFQALADGGYRVTRAEPEASDEAALGAWRPAPETDGPQSLQLPFAFPIGEARYREVDVWAVPLLAFGSDEPCTAVCVGASGVPAPDHPLVLPFLLPTDFDAGRDVSLRIGPDRVDVRWEMRGVAGQRSEHQAALFPDGTVEIRYSGPERHPRSGAAGLHPGGAAAVTTAFAWVSRTVPAGTAVLDPYGARFATLAQARALRMVPFVFGATAFVLLLIPLFLRRGVLDPLSDLLAAVDRVDRGERGVRVVTRATDEFGALGRRFNRMSASLGAAESELREYAETLEAHVVERTRALRDANATLAEQRDVLSASLDELRTTQARLVQSEKQASLGRLTAGIAHELRNPLNFVTNFAELSVDLAEDLDEDLLADPARSAGDLTPELVPMLDDLRDNMARVLEHGRRAERIVEAMVLHAPKAPAPHRRSDLNALLRLAAEGAGRAYTARRGAPPEIELDLGSDVGEVTVQAEGVVQVAVSLLENALHAAHPDGGVCLRSRRDDGVVTVEVADGGPGMDAETSSRVFEPFFTTKPPGEGTGLGLSLAYDIVTAGHGGEIELETAPGEGATFTVHLPVDVTDEVQAPVVVPTPLAATPA